MNTEHYDVCIVGAGIAGLNALFVASRYLTPDHRILLIDRRERVGGMWVDTYDYVRLHQPHGLFTAGNIPWTLGRNPSYLATKDEVLDHFDHCLDVIGQRVQVVERYGWSFESHDETDEGVRIMCRSADGRSMEVTADKLIKAYGFRVVPNDPLETSSTRVQSVSPDYCDMRSAQMRASDAPVWVVGGGKTAMDTAHALITEYPGREVNLVAGSGTFFASRDKFYPAGTRRWWYGSLVSSIARKASRAFDGTNAKAVTDSVRNDFGTWCTPDADNFLIGVLSEAENRTIADGLNQVIMDHFVDVVDRDDTTQIVLRSGSKQTVQPGSWIVNCTGYMDGGDHPYEPYVSDGGAVISIQNRSATMHLTSFAAYYLTHLLFLGKIKDVPLYELDMPVLRKKSSLAFPLALFTLAQYNLSLVYDAVPAKVLTDCGLDFDRWYPLPRRAAATARFLLTHRRDREHLRHVLDSVADHFDVRCGTLPVVSTIGSVA